MYIKIDRKREHSKKTLAKWHKTMCENFYRLADKSESRGYPDSYSHFKNLAEEHRRNSGLIS